MSKSVPEAHSNAGIGSAVLSGGKASRYGGVAKGLIDVEPGLTILARTVQEIVCAGVPEVVILANDSEPYRSIGLPVAADLRHGVGPLAGIEAGLAYYEGRYRAVIFLPCDLPGITRKEIATLLSAFEAGGEEVVFAETGVFFEHPLCAVVHIGLREAISNAIDAGRTKVGELWHDFGGVAVHFEDPTPFSNVNTPEDMARWRQGRKVDL